MKIKESQTKLKLKLLQKACICIFLVFVINIDVLSLPVFNSYCKTNSFNEGILAGFKNQKAYASDTDASIRNHENNNEDDNDDDNGEDGNDNNKNGGGKDKHHKKARCNDGIDNDNDGAIDFPSDFGCSSLKDKDESFPKAACQDGKDNDNDGFVDFPADSGCNSNQDNDEFNLNNTSTSGGTTTSSGGTTSSTSSTGGTTTSSGNPSIDNSNCPDAATLCSQSARLSCFNPDYSLICLNTTFNCCKVVNSSLSCDPSLLVCKPVNNLSSSSSGLVSGSSSSSTSSGSLRVDIISTPKLPSVVPLPLLPDEDIGKIGIAYFGSNPSFEIKIPENKSNLKIVSVDLKDKQGILFTSIPFTVTKISGSPDRLILGLTLPDNLSLGESVFMLNLESGENLIGIIQIIEFLDIQVPVDFITIKNVSKPIITRIRTKLRKEKVIIALRGKSFVGRGVFLQQDDERRFVYNPPHQPHTTITIYPSNLNLDLAKRATSKRGKRMRIKLKTSEKIKGRINAVLIIATPRGIVSEHFQIKRN